MKHFQKLASLMAIGMSLFTFTPVMAATPPVDADFLLPSNIPGNIGLSSAELRTVVARIIRQILTFVGIIILVIMVWAGFLWMTAAGNDEAIGKAKKMMIGAIIGLAIVLLAYAITNFVIDALVTATTAV